MPSLKKIKIITLVLLCLSTLSAQTITINTQQQSNLGIKTQEVTAIDSISYTPYNGTVVLDKKDVISISSNVESIVKEIYISDFEHVKRGQKLVTLKSNALLSLQRDYIESTIESQSASQNYQRNIKLELDGIISKKKLLESKKQQESIEVIVKLNSSQLLTNGFSKAMLQKIKETHIPIVEQDIYSPKDGVVYKININIGEYVQADHMMLGIYGDGKRYIELSIPVKIVESLTIGDKCTFSKYSAKISAIGNVVNVSSQSVQVRAEIDNANGIMINRIYGVKIHKKVSNAVKIKKTALVFDSGASYVFKKAETGFDVVSVEIISEGPVCYIVKADLEDGDLLAVSSTSSLLSAMESNDE